MKRNGINKFEGHPGKLHWKRRQNVSFLLRLRFFFFFFFKFVSFDMGSDPNNDYVLIIVTIMTNVDND